MCITVYKPKIDPSPSPSLPPAQILQTYAQHYNSRRLRVTSQWRRGLNFLHHQAATLSVSQLTLHTVRDFLSSWVKGFSLFCLVYVRNERFVSLDRSLYYSTQQTESLRSCQSSMLIRILGHAQTVLSLGHFSTFLCILSANQDISHFHKTKMMHGEMSFVVNETWKKDSGEVA